MPHNKISNKLHIEKLNISDNCEALFSKLFKKKPNSFWLDSSLVEKGLSRYSFMGAGISKNSYSIYYTVHNNLIQKVDSDLKVIEEKKQSIFQFLENVTCQQNIKDHIYSIPFIGGYVGYFGYELKTLTCGVESHTSSKPDAAFHYVDRLIIVDHLYDKKYIAGLYSGEKERRELLTWITRVKLSIKKSHLPNVSSNTQKKQLVFTLRHGKDEYLKMIGRCLKNISDGESYEICLTNKIFSSVNLDSYELYKNLRKNNPAPYSAYIRFSSFDIVSSSPEKYLSIDKKRNIVSKPIKGTAPRGNTEIDDESIKTKLRNDEKTRSENLMIVDLLRNDIGKISEKGSVTVPKLMNVETYKTLHQLVSTIKGKINAKSSIINCIAACFPGGSMTGAPKIRTLEIIDQLEGEAREIYSGAIGYISFSGEVDLSIVIRTIIVEKDYLSIGCGGAIIALSDPEEEFNEILLKAKAPIDSILETLNINKNEPLIINGIH